MLSIKPLNVVSSPSQVVMMTEAIEVIGALEVTVATEAVEDIMMTVDMVEETGDMVVTVVTAVNEMMNITSRVKAKEHLTELFC